MPIREAIPEDFDRIWPFFHEIVAAGETFAYPPDATKEVGFDLWFGHGHRVFVYEEDGAILGTYFIRQNQPGLGGHVCNCGYMVSPTARPNPIMTPEKIPGLAVGRMTPTMVCHGVAPKANEPFTRCLGTPKMASSDIEKIVGITAKPMASPTTNEFRWS